MAEEQGSKLAEFIRRKLIDMDISANKLSKEMGVSHSTIGDILNGNSTHPTNRILEALSRVTNTPFNIIAEMVAEEAVHNISVDAALVANIYDSLPAEFQEALMASARALQSNTLKTKSDVENKGKITRRQKGKKGGDV
jgi:transcriptional regulator with XRE-family HTH domain